MRRCLNSMCAIDYCSQTSLLKTFLDLNINPLVFFLNLNDKTL